MTDSDDLVTYRVEPARPGSDGLVAYLTLNDPARRNALSDALLDQLGELCGARHPTPRSGSWC